MKILVFTPYFCPKTGGVEEHVLNICLSLAKRGYEIVVVTSKSEKEICEEEGIDKLKVYRLPYQFVFSNTPVNLSWFIKIKQIINNEKPDLIMAHSPVPFMADLAIIFSGKIPTILKYHSGSMIKEGKPIVNLIISLYESYFLKFIIKRANYLLCTSDFVRNGLLKDFKYKSTTITPGVNPGDFINNRPSRSLQPTILFVGRLDKTSRWKGLNYLIEAIPKVISIIPSANLLVVGGGDDLDTHKRLVEQLNLKKNIEFVGSVKRLERMSYFKKADVLVLPSTSDAESFGIVLIEAMASKIPVIGSKVGGIPYVIDDTKDGLLSLPRDPNSIADAIIKILLNPSLAKKMGEYGRKKVVSKYTWEIKVSETEDIILKVVNKK